jgi:hypothetical protein
LRLGRAEAAMRQAEIYVHKRRRDCFIIGAIFQL